MAIGGGRLPQFLDNYEGRKMRVLVDTIEKTFTRINGLLLAKKFNMRATRSTTQAIPNATQTQVEYVTESWDVDGVYDVTTYRYTPGTAGYYQAYAQTQITGLANGSYALMTLRKNGTDNTIGQKIFNTTGGSNDTASNVCGVIYLDENDYIDVTIEHNNGSSRNISASPTINMFSVYKVG